MIGARLGPRGSRGEPTGLHILGRGFAGLTVRLGYARPQESDGNSFQHGVHAFSTSLPQTVAIDRP